MTTAARKKGTKGSMTSTEASTGQRGGCVCEETFDSELYPLSIYNPPRFDSESLLILEGFGGPGHPWLFLVR